MHVFSALAAEVFKHQARLSQKTFVIMTNVQCDVFNFRQQLSSEHLYRRLRLKGFESKPSQKVSEATHAGDRVTNDNSVLCSLRQARVIGDPAVASHSVTDDFETCQRNRMENYVKGETLGEGSFGVVFRAVHKQVLPLQESP